MKTLIPSLALLLLLLAGCSKTPEAPPPVAPLAPLSAEIRSAAAQRGKAIVTEAFSLLSSNLQTAIQQGGVSNALPFCSLAASPLTASMASKHGVALRRVTQKARNPADKVNADELSILRQFEAAIPASTNPPPPIVTNFVASTATFFAPIILSKELCLQCHGVSGKDIAPENLAVIQRLYPQDEATGFKLGDLRGAWRVDFPLATLSAGR